MKSTIALTLLAVFGLASAFAADDENHEIIEKVMKNGLKGDESPAAKVVEGSASDADIKSLAELIGTLKGTKAPVGEQADYEKKVTALIAAIDAIAGGDKSETAVKAFEEAHSCKPCHSVHKPKKEQ